MNKENVPIKNESDPYNKFIFCFECADYVYEYCSLHGPPLVIPDDEVPPTTQIFKQCCQPTAVRTIPSSFLRIASSSIRGGGLGVFTTEILPRGVRFGPYKGIRTTEVNSSYCWQISYDNIGKVYFDALDTNHSNWMRYINCARHWSEQNLVAHLNEGYVYYSTIKIIPRNTELLVYCGSEFANALNIDLHNYSKPRNMLKMIGLKMDEEPNNKVVPKSQYYQHVDERELPAWIPKMRYSCSECAYQTNCLRNLRRHKTSHLNYEPFQCSQCEYKTKIYEYLKKHMTRHVRTKGYICSKCNHKTYRKEDLRLHKLIHLPYDPIACDLCDFRTNNSKNLKKHMLRHALTQ